MTAPAFIPDDSGLFPVSFPRLTTFELRALNTILRAWEEDLLDAGDAELAIQAAATVSLRRIEQERGK